MEDNKDTQVVENQEPIKVEPEKTYTKEDIDASFNAGVKKANSEWQKDAKYKEFLEWKEAGKKDSDKLNELQASYDAILKENNTLKATNEVAKNDVKPEFAKFVTSEVMNMVNDTITLEDAIKTYKKDNPQYFGEVVVKKVQTSPNLVGGNTPQNANSIMNDILRNCKK